MFIFKNSFGQQRVNSEKNRSKGGKSEPLILNLPHVVHVKADGSAPLEPGSAPMMSSAYILFLDHSLESVQSIDSS